MDEVELLPPASLPPRRHPAPLRYGAVPVEEFERERMGREESSSCLVVVVERSPGEEQEKVSTRRKKEDEGWELRSQLQEWGQLQQENGKRFG